MPDRLEREIEDVLSKVEDFEWHRRRRRSRRLLRALRPQRPHFPISEPANNPLAAYTRRLVPGHLMLAGFLLVLVSLVFGGFDGIWRGLVVAGIALALLGVAWSARRPHRPARRQQGGWWRDRYITYDDPESPSRPFWRRRR